MRSSRMSIGASLTIPEGNDSQSDHDTDLATDDIDMGDSSTAEIGFDYEVSSESDEDNDEWKGIGLIYTF